MPLPVLPFFKMQKVLVGYLPFFLFFAVAMQQKTHLPLKKESSAYSYPKTEYKLLKDQKHTAQKKIDGILLSPERVEVTWKGRRGP